MTPIALTVTLGTPKDFLEKYWKWYVLHLLLVIHHLWRPAPLKTLVLELTLLNDVS